MGERFKAKVIERVEGTFGVSLDAEAGDWSLDGTVTLRGLTVRAQNAPGEEPPLLVADEVEVKTDVEFFARRARLVSMNVDGVRVHITRRSDGSSNVATVLDGLNRLAKKPKKKEGDAAAKNRLRFLRRSIPKVRLSGIDVSFKIAGALPGISRLARNLSLRDGTLTLDNPSVVKEDDKAVLALRFERTSLSPRSGFEVNTELSLKTGLKEARLNLDQPIVLPLAGQSLSVGGASYRKAGLRKIASVEAIKMNADASSAGRMRSIEMEAVRAEFDPSRPLRDIVREIRSKGLTRDGLQSLQKLEIVRPSLVFQSHDLRSDFKELSERLAGMSKPQSGDSEPDKALGVLMKASRAAAERFVQGKQGSGPILQKALNGNWKRIQETLRTLGPALGSLSRRLPINHVSLREGIFSWQGEQTADNGHALAHRFENFRVQFTRTPERTSVLDIGFVVPGEDSDGNALQVTVDEVTGQTQLDLKVKNLPLFPYRHVFPKSLPVTEKTRLHDTDFSLIWSPQTGIAKVFGDAKASYLTLAAPRLAEDLLMNMRLGGSFDATLDLNSDALSLHKSSFRLGALKTKIHGSLTQLGTSPIIEGTVQLERIRCQEIVDSLPQAFIPHLKTMRVTGTFGALMNLRLDTDDIESLTYDVFPALHGFSVTDTGVLDFEAVRGTFTHRLQEADGTMREFQVGPDAPHWVSLDDISKFMPKAITTTEDGSFFRHNGFSGYAIKRSIITNLEKGGFYRGASTVSQQLVKNLFLSRAKTISRKLQEMFITWRLEKILSKTRIMELYLNVIELGPGIYGIKHAARHYFDKHPRDLSLLECVFIASLIPSPNRYYKQFARGEVTPGWRRYLRTLIGVMRQRDKITQSDYLAAAPYSPIFRGQKAPETDDGEVDPPPIIPWRLEGQGP